MRLRPAGTRPEVKGGFRDRLFPRLWRKERTTRKNMMKAKDAIAAARSDRHAIHDRELDCYKDTDGTVYRCLLDEMILYMMLRLSLPYGK